jgi:hypothetical protein
VLVTYGIQTYGIEEVGFIFHRHRHIVYMLNYMPDVGEQCAVVDEEVEQTGELEDQPARRVCVGLNKV